MNKPKLAFYSFFTIIFCAFLQVMPIAIADDPYIVDNVLVEADGASATEARNAAIDRGQAQAFTLLLQQLNASAVSIPKEQVPRMVQGFEVTEEKIAATHYQAVMKVTFSPAAVQAALQHYKASSNTPATSAIVLLPVLKQGDTLTLWEDNPWHDALAAVLQSKQGGNYILPLGDLEDIGALDVASLPSVTYAQLAKFTQKYAAQKILIAQVELTGASAGLTLSMLDPAKKSEKTLNVAAAPNEDASALLKRAAEQLIAPTAAQAGAVPVGAFFTVNAHFNSLGEWVNIRNALAKDGPLQKSETTQISAQNAIIEVYFQGDKAALMAFFKQKGLAAREEGANVVIGAPHQQ